MVSDTFAHGGIRIICKDVVDYYLSTATNNQKYANYYCRNAETIKGKTMNEKPKACPCGCKAKVQISPMRGYQIKSKCGMRTGYYGSEQVAISIWNNRVIPDSVRELCDFIDKAIEYKITPTCMKQLVAKVRADYEGEG